MRNQLSDIGINVNQSSGETKSTCPKCSADRKNSRDKCLSVNVSEGIWNCHNCGWAGKVKQLKKEYVMPIKNGTNMSDFIVKWFANRKITTHTLEVYKVKEGVEFMPQVNEERKVIMFNYYLDDKLINTKFRDRDKNFKMVSGARLIPYGIDVATFQSKKEILICEGEVDCLSFYEAGIRFAVSVPAGASKGNQKLEWLDECWHLFEGKKIYLATDNDEPGIALRNELARRFGKSNCMIVPLSRKDANEILMTDGSEELVRCFENSYSFPVEGIEDANSIKEELLNLYDVGVPQGCELNWDMDIGFKWNAGQVTLITGIPGHGKSTFIKNILWRLASLHGWKSLIYSAEEASISFAVADMLQIASGKAFFDSRLTKRISKEEIAELEPILSQHFKYYRMDNDLSVEAILQKGEEMVKQYGIRMLVIDNMSTVEKSMSNQSETRHHQIKNMMNDISKFARNYGVHVILVAHPRKMSKLKDAIEVPTGYDVGDSSHWFNLIDNGLTAYRNLATGLTEIHKWKIRFWYTGKLGVDYFKFNIHNCTFQSAEQVNDGSDKNKFIGQPYGKETFANLPDPF